MVATPFYISFSEIHGSITTGELDSLPGADVLLIAPGLACEF
jgi:hypothetical protein